MEAADTLRKLIHLFKEYGDIDLKCGSNGNGMVCHMAKNGKVVLPKQDTISDAKKILGPSFDDIIGKIKIRYTQRQNNVSAVIEHVAHDNSQLSIQHISGNINENIGKHPSHAIPNEHTDKHPPISVHTSNYFPTSGHIGRLPSNKNVSDMIVHNSKPFKLPPYTSTESPSESNQPNVTDEINELKHQIANDLSSKTMQSAKRTQQTLSQIQSKINDIQKLLAQANIECTYS
jgi:hypothetical protein